MVITNFRELEVWRRSIVLSKKVYSVTGDFPKREDYGLTSQIRRAVVSISSNLAEGSGRGTKRDFANFVSVSLGGLRETQSQLFLSKELGYLDEEDLLELDSDIEELARMLIGFRRYLLKSQIN